MKKLLLLLSLISIISCSKHDDDDYKEKIYNGPTYLEPPTWLQGIWMDDKHRGFKFTEYDLLYKYPMPNYISASSEIDYYASQLDEYEYPDIQEIELKDIYSLKYYMYSGQSRKFIFTKISDNQIESSGFMPGIYTKQ